LDWLPKQQNSEKRPSGRFFVPESANLLTNRISALLLQNPQEKFPFINVFNDFHDWKIRQPEIPSCLFKNEPENGRENNTP